MKDIEMGGRFDARAGAGSARRRPFVDRLDAEHRQSLSVIPDGMLDISQLDRSRELVSQLMQAAAARQAAIEGVAVNDCQVPAAAGRPRLLIRLYEPLACRRPTPVMLYIHGGGYVFGEVWQFDAQCKQLAQGANIAVASIEYRRAPEHPYPVPLEDCYAALAWLHAEAAAREFDANNIGVGGTSAGAGLAAGLALLSRDRGEHKLAFQLLEAPMLDHRGITASSRSVDHPKVWNTAVNSAAWTAYLGDGHLERSISPYASPSLATDLSRLPPAYICIAAHDLFLDESFDYAQRLLHADVSVRFNVYEMGFHGSARAAPNAEVSVRWRSELASALKRLAESSIN
jgi:acetyl esterase/lipase